jgi:hypothetical protein
MTSSEISAAAGDLATSSGTGDATPRRRSAPLGQQEGKIGSSFDEDLTLTTWPGLP